MIRTKYEDGVQIFQMLNSAGEWEDIEDLPPEFEHIRHKMKQTYYFDSSIRKEVMENPPLGEIIFIDGLEDFGFDINGFIIPKTDV